MGAEHRERIAVLEQWMEAGVEAAAVRMTGTGRMRWNLDRSVPQLVTTDAELHASVALPGMGTMQLSGTVRMRMSTLPDPGTAPPP